MATAKKAAPVKAMRMPRPVAPGSTRRVRAKTLDEPKSTMLHVRLDDRLKADAISVLDEIGISLSEALRVFLRRVVSDGAIPFRLEVPNATTRAAMAEARRMTTLPTYETAEALFDELEKGRLR